jgi:hypothetical protein
LDLVQLAATVASLHATRQSVLLYEGDFPVLEILVGKSGKQPKRRGSPLSQAISVRSSISTRVTWCCSSLNRAGHPADHPGFSAREGVMKLPAGD